jgi:6,7-dimethyl-8-ribityllumazine synthase
MPVKEYEGRLNADGLRFDLVVSRFNDFITSRLLGGALDALRRCGAAEGDLRVVRVPGAWEIPLAAKKLAARADRADAIICLGAVIRGSTGHYDHVCSEVAKGVAAVGMDSGLPVLFGVLTCDTIEQAVERAGSKAGNKGFDAAMAAIEMADLARALDGKE